MDPNLLQTKLLRAARTDIPSDAVPYCFEKRVMARIQALPAPDKWSALSQALWRAAAPCAAVAIMLCAWTVFVPETTSPTDEFAQHFENTVLAGITSDQFAGE
jgi:hypothetical protein